MTARDDFEDLWTLAEEEKRKNEEKQTQESNKQSIETHVLFIGSQNSGKTTLILQFLDREEPPKPTIALEYTYGRRPKGINMAKDVTHLWELGGGTMLSKLISVPITPETISNVSVIIVLDLSKPEELWDTLEVLLKELKMRVKEVISEMKNDHFDVVAQMKRKAKEKYGTGHPDESVLSPLMIPVAIIGTKYDIFQEFDPEKKKIISKTLRYVAHQYGASLFYFSNKSDSMINRCKQLVGHYAFGHPLSQTISMDYNKPLIVPVGCDAIGHIGVPSLSSGDDLARIGAQSKSPFDIWKQAYCGYFPQVKHDKGLGEDPCKDERYKESAIDSMRIQKDQELEKYRRECEKKAKQKHLIRT